MKMSDPPTPPRTSATDRANKYLLSLSSEKGYPSTKDKKPTIPISDDERVKIQALINKQKRQTPLLPPLPPPTERKGGKSLRFRRLRRRSTTNHSRFRIRRRRKPKSKKQKRAI